MSTSFFRNFDVVNYSFGNGERPVAFQKLTQFVSVLDDTRDNAAFYNLYTIIAGERPDTLSYKLYGTTDHYWTFFLLNDKLRESGWPIASYDLLDEAKSKYPYRMVTTNSDITTDNGSFELFPIGQEVSGSSSGTTGTIIRKIPEKGQIIIDTGDEPNTQNFDSTETIRYVNPDGGFSEAKLIKESEQYNAVHHYEDADGVYQDLTLYDFGTPAASWTAVTYRDRIENRNDDLKEIVVIKPSVINGIVSEFKSLMKQKL